MIEEQGVVVALIGDHAEVRAERRPSCGTCGAQGGCGTALIDRFLGRRSITLRATNQAGAAIGDRVVVGVSEEALTEAALAAYLVPILGLVIGGALGQWGAQLLAPDALGPDSNLGALIGAASGFLLALSWLRRYSARQTRHPAGRPVVLRRLSREPPLTPSRKPADLD